MWVLNHQLNPISEIVQEKQKRFYCLTFHFYVIMFGGQL